MAGRIPDAFIDDLVARTDIVEVIGARVPLKRAGREYQARCPFHDERTPSFTVSPTKQFYHCFGCGAHGTAIRFLMDYERMEFLDAVEELASRAGMEVPRETRQRNQDGEVRDLYAALEAAQGFFRRQLAGADVARDYLARRGVDEATAGRFGIGWAPQGWDALKSALGTDARRLKLLERAGLLSSSDGGRVYDKFRARVMFPIHDRRGRVIAFGGRVLEKDDGPKYLNSPETALFHKGRELYGLWQVRQAHAKIPRLVVVEGYMDVVSLFQFGVDTAVATLGTATTPDHAELLFRNAADVYFCFDGDRAGRAAAWKAVESVLPRMRDGRQAFYLFLPDGEDPDSIVRAEGAGGFDQRLQAATPLSEFVFAELSAEVNLNTLDGRARLAERARPLLQRIPDGAFRDLMLQQLTTLTGVGAAADGPQSAAPVRPPPRAGVGAGPAWCAARSSGWCRCRSWPPTCRRRGRSPTCASPAWPCWSSCWRRCSSARACGPAPCWNSSPGAMRPWPCSGWPWPSCPGTPPAGGRSSSTRSPAWSAPGCFSASRNCRPPRRWTRTGRTSSGPCCWPAPGADHDQAASITRCMFRPRTLSTTRPPWPRAAMPSAMRW